MSVVSSCSPTANPAKPPDKAQRFAEAAAGLLGTPFRLHGRNASTGLDCVGLILVALQKAGLPVSQIPAYGLRNSDYSFILDMARFSGFVTTTERLALGDIVVAKPGPSQRHLLVCIAPQNFIHAHASLRRVVAMPGPVPWPIDAIYRLIEKD